ncbi:MAG: hypothetical protein PHC95_14585 [Parabacteroides sp.]|nr:hypothetical protein [Parabacteroides sp.]
MDLKTWLSSSGIEFEDTTWKVPPAYPYGVYMDDSSTRGADDKLFIAEHDVTIELYSDAKGTLVSAEADLEALFISNAMAFESLGKNWIESERHWQSTYSISYVEKI